MFFELSIFDRLYIHIFKSAFILDSNLHASDVPLLTHEMIGRPYNHMTESVFQKKEYSIYI